MNPNEVVKEITRRKPLPPTQRATHGAWVEPAQAVAGLVEKGWSPTDAVREVISVLKLHPPEKAEKGIRAAYYALREKM